MRISDWSSDVCSSDLQARHAAAGCAGPRPEHWRRDERHHRDARQAAAGHWPGMDRPVLRGTPERRPGTNGLCPVEIGRAHVLTPVTNAHLVCRLLLEKKKTSTMTIYLDGTVSRTHRTH